MTNQIHSLLHEIAAEVERADKMYPVYASDLEFRGVLESEVDEVKAEIQKRDRVQQRLEVIQVAAVCVRQLRRLGELER